MKETKDDKLITAIDISGKINAILNQNGYDDLKIMLSKLGDDDTIILSDKNKEVIAIIK